MSETSKSQGAISEANARLNEALQLLEVRLSDLADQMQDLEASRKDLDAVRQSETALKAQLEEAESREADFAKLAEETTKELDTVIAEVRDALGEGQG